MLKFILCIFTFDSIKKILIFTLFLSSIELFSQGVKIISEGEEIEYVVSFLGINLGTIKVISEGIEDYNNLHVYKVKAIIKSFEGIPFVGISTIYESWIDTSISYSHRFIGNSKFLSNDWLFQKLDFDYKSKKIHNEIWQGGKQIYKNSVRSDKKWNDGLSLFFLARQFTDIKKSIKIPTFMDKDTAFTMINFSGKREEIKIDAINYPVKTIYFSGKADWEGVYGLTGYFEGWFSDDEARVPIKAKMKVLIGSVTIELSSWKRQGWQPPKAN